MSTPDPGPDQPPSDGPSASRHHDPATDPGRAQPFETLYRGQPSEGPAGAHRVTARHYETSLTPPDEHDPGDQFHWLYRPEPGPGAQSAPSVEPATELFTEAAQVERAMDPAPALAPPPGPRPDEPSKRSRPRKVLVILLVLLVVAAAVAAAIVLQDRTGSSGAPTPGVVPASSVPPTVTGTGPSAQTSASPSTTAASDTVPYAGAVVPVAADQIKADCEAPGSTDGAGHPVRYDPEQLGDGDLNTAWRCEGSGKKHTITFSFGAATRVAQLGLVNGYTKIDPENRADRYGEYRRVERVRWTFPDGTSFSQDLADRTETMQTMRIPPQTAAQVRLTILASTSPGESAKTRDAVLISEVGFATPQS